MKKIQFMTVLILFFCILNPVYSEQTKKIKKVRYPVVIEDDYGQKTGVNRKITLKKPAATIVVGEIGCALALLRMGLKDKIIGASGWVLEEVPGLSGIPSIGGHNGIDIELLIALSPDIYIDFKGHSDAAAAQLKNAGIQMYSVGTVRNLEHIIEHITEYGMMFNKMKEAYKITDEIDKTIMQVKKKVLKINTAHDNKPAVFMFGYMGDKNTLQNWSPAGNTIIEDLIIKAGGRCLTAEQGLIGWPQYSIESLLASDPDVIILPRGKYEFQSVEEFTSLEIVKSLKAVKNKRVYLIDKPLVFHMSYKNARALSLFYDFINGM